MGNIQALFLWKNQVFISSIIRPVIAHRLGGFTSDDIEGLGAFTSDELEGSANIIVMS